MTNAVEKTEYTFTFDKNDERQFKRIQDRLDPEEYNVVNDIHPVNPEDKRSELETTMVMEPEAASTFRFGMKKLKIRRFRNEEELAAEEAEAAKNRVTIRVKVDGYDPNSP